jgi:hypothetical protein
MSKLEQYPIAKHDKGQGLAPDGQSLTISSDWYDNLPMGADNFKELNL